MCNESKMAAMDCQGSGDDMDYNEGDITFEVGINNDTWRLTGHRNALAAKNEVFRIMLCGEHYKMETVIQIKDVDKRAFEQLLKYLTEDKVSFQSVETARATLEAAHKYLCPGLVKECVRYLDLNLTASNVLYVFQNLRMYCSQVPASNNAPTAPPLNIISNSDDPKEKVYEICDPLLHNCLLFIDEHADAVLQQEFIEELSYEDMATIAPRDTLNVTCEMELFHALNRWCKSECKRKKKELTPDNRRQVLGTLSYSVRYLLMTEKEFIEGPQASELLDLIECQIILARKRNQRCAPLNGEQERQMRMFETPRSHNIHLKPIVLSERSEVKIIKLDNKINEKSVDAKKKKKKRCCRSKKAVDLPEPEDKGCNCSCFGMGLLRAFVCIFD